MLPDYHVHTPLSKHASGEPAEYREVARSAGMKQMGFSDHAPVRNPLLQHVSIDLVDFPKYRDAVTDLQDGKEPDVLFGTEADYYPQCEDFLDPWLSEQGFDYIIGSVHLFDNWLFDDPSNISSWDGVSVPGAYERYFQAITMMVRTGMFNIVGHPDLPKKFGHRVKDSHLRELACRFLDEVLEAKMAVEINTSGLRRPVGEMYPSPLVLSLVAEREIPITFGSDAHKPSWVGADFDKALDMALDTGCREYATFEQGQMTRLPLPTNTPAPE